MAASILRSSPLLTSRLTRFSTFPHLHPTFQHFRRRFLTSRFFFSSSSSFTSFFPPPSRATFLQETLSLETLTRSPLEWVPRIDLYDELGPADVGRRVRLCGWVAFHRVHGGLTFINLREHSGLVQVTTLPEEFPEAYATAYTVRLEYVVAVEGTVFARLGQSLNKKMQIGDI